MVTLVTGCGGSSYTKGDFVARADAICTSTLRQTRALAPPSSTSQPGGALAVYLGQLVPLVQSEANQLRALKRPADNAHDRATLTAYYNALAQIVANYGQLEAAARRGDTQIGHGHRGDAPRQPGRRPSRELRAANLWHSRVHDGLITQRRASERRPVPSDPDARRPLAR